MKLLTIIFLLGTSKIYASDIQNFSEQTGINNFLEYKGYLQYSKVHKHSFGKYGLWDKPIEFAKKSTLAEDYINKGVRLYESYDDCLNVKRVGSPKVFCNTECEGDKTPNSCSTLSAEFRPYEEAINHYFYQELRQVGKVKWAKIKAYKNEASGWIPLEQSEGAITSFKDLFKVEKKLSYINLKEAKYQKGLDFSKLPKEIASLDRYYIIKEVKILKDGNFLLGIEAGINTDEIGAHEDPPLEFTKNQKKYSTAGFYKLQAFTSGGALNLWGKP